MSPFLGHARSAHCSLVITFLVAASMTFAQEAPDLASSADSSLAASRERLRQGLLESGAPADLPDWLESSSPQSLLSHAGVWFRDHTRPDSSDEAIERQWSNLRTGIAAVFVRDLRAGALTHSDITDMCRSILSRDPDAGLAVAFLQSSAQTQARSDSLGGVRSRDLFDSVHPAFERGREPWPERRDLVDATAELLSEGRELGLVDAARFRAFTDKLIQMLADPSEHPKVRRAAIHQAGRLHVAGAIPELRRILDDEASWDSPDLAGASCHALAMLGDAESRPRIARVFRSLPQEAVRRDAAQALATLGGIESLRLLMHGVTVPSSDEGSMTIHPDGSVTKSFAPDDPIVRRAVAEMEPWILGVLRSAGPPEAIRDALLATQFLGPREEIEPVILEFLSKSPSRESTRLAVSVWFPRVSRSGAQSVLGIVPRTDLTDEQVRRLEHDAYATPIPSRDTTLPNPHRAPALSRGGNHSAKEVGDPSYKMLSQWILEWFGFGELGHTGIFVGLDELDAPQIIEVGTAVPHVVKLNPWDAMDCEEPFCWGTFTLESTTLGFDKRHAIVSLARELLERTIPIAYPLLPTPDALRYSGSLNSIVDVGEITHLRCDGLVEYCYERSGFPVWGPYASSSDISNTCCVQDHADLYVPPGNPDAELAPVVQCGHAGGSSTHMTEPAQVDVPFTSVSTTTTCHGSLGAFVGISFEAVDRSGIHFISVSWDSGDTWIDTPHAGLFAQESTLDIEVFDWVDGPQMVYYTAMDNAGNVTPVREVYVDTQDDCPGATVGGFAVIEGVAEWLVESELETARYVIESAPAFVGPWTSAASAPAGVGARAIPLRNADHRFFRLVEVEEGGRRLVHGIARASGRARPSEVAALDSAVLRETLDRAAGNRASAGGDVARGRSDVERVVILTVDPYVADLNAYVADYWETVAGYDVQVVSVGAAQTPDPEARREAIWSLMSFYVVSGVHRFHLVGDANDWQEFDGPKTALYWVGSWQGIRQDYLTSGYPAGGQPALNQIPTYAIPDPAPRGTNMSYVTPYYLSDFEYVRGRDAVVTRWPVSESAELLAIATKMQQHNNRGDFPPPPLPTALFYIGDLDFDDPGDGQRAVQVAQRMLGELDGFLTQLFYRSEHGSGSWLTGEAAMAWNANYFLRLAALTGSLSTRYRVADIFDKEYVGYPFTVDLLTTPPTALVIGATCSSADFARTERSLAPPIGGPNPHCEDFLFADDKGAIAWVGPTVGSWQNGNEEIAARFVEELVDHPNRAMADSWKVACDRVAAELPLGHHAQEALRSYVFLGDPFTPFEPSGHPVAAPSPGAHQVEFALQPATSNPFSDSIRLTLTMPEKAPAELCIYDVRGSLVRVLHRGPLDAGRHDIDWHGEDHEGCITSPGIYFARAESRGRSITRKLVRVR